MGGTRSTLTELGQVLTRRSQVPIAHFPSAGPHRVQGTPKICSPCYTRVSLLLGDTRKEIPTQRFHLKCSHSDAVRIYCCYLICSSSARAHTSSPSAFQCLCTYLLPRGSWRLHCISIRYSVCADVRRSISWTVSTTPWLWRVPSLTWKFNLRKWHSKLWQISW
jgi:hypothetical protein